MNAALLRIGGASVAILVLFGAEAAAEPITFDEALRRAMQFNHGLNASRLTAESAGDAARQAEAFPNPSLDGRFEDLGREELELTLSQTIELGGKRGARTDAARAEARAAGFAHGAAKLALEAETVRRFAAAVAAGRRIVLVDASLHLAAGTRDQIETRIRAGATRESDLMQAEIAIEELRIERARLARDREKALVALAALWGAAEPESLTVSEIFSERVLPPPLDSLRVSMGEHPGTLRLRERSAFAAADLSLARAGRIPDLEIGAGVIRYGESDDENLVLSASLPLPLFNRNRAAIRERERLAEAAEYERREALSLREADLRSIRADIVGASETLLSLDGAIIPRARSAYERVRTYYGSGAVSFLEMNEARRDLVRLQLRRIETQYERALAAADLIEIAGCRLPVFTER
jgi:cobalt-zinc-cadmium efflux system outer membrane protein